MADMGGADVSDLSSQMIKAYLKAMVGYMQCDEPSPKLVWMISTIGLMQLRFETQSSPYFKVEQRISDGCFEFMGLEVLENNKEESWRLCPKSEASEGAA
jgi:hypothetical protein